MLMYVGWLKVKPNGLATPDLLYLIADIDLIEYASLSVYDFKEICGKLQHSQHQREAVENDMEQPTKAAAP